MSRDTVNRLPLLKEPLVHFLCAGVALFVVYASLDRSQLQEDPGTSVVPIVVAEAQLDHLTLTWKQLWDREPTPQELTRLVNDYIREEVLYREAIELGLDSDDTIVRRRMAQKMAFLSKGAAPNDPTDEELRDWYDGNRQRYEFPDTVSFSHIYFSTEKRGPGAFDDAKETLAGLKKEASPPSRAPERGDRFMTRYDFVSIGEQDLRNLFGGEFTLGVFELDSGAWHGPLESSYGVHLVHLTERSDRHVPEFEVVRTSVEMDWMQEQIQSANRALRGVLSRKYGGDIDAEVKSRLDDEQLISPER